MTNKITLKTSLIGIIPSIVNLMIWGIIFLVAIQWLSSTLASTMTAQFNEYIQYDGHSTEPWEAWWTPDFWRHEELYFIGIGRLICWVILGYIAYCTLEVLLYGTSSTIIFHLNDTGSIIKMEDYELKLFYSESSEILPCNRIVSVVSKSSTIDKILGTGTLVITFVTFINSETEEKEWYINGITSPNQYREEIMKASPNHEGMLVQLNNKS